MFTTLALLENFEGFSQILTLIYAAVGLNDTQSEWLFLLKVPMYKIVKLFVFLVQSIVFVHMFQIL